MFVDSTPGLQSTVLELPEVCKTGEGIKASQSADVQSRVNFVELDATSPKWPVDDAAFEIVLMSYISGEYDRNPPPPSTPFSRAVHACKQRRRTTFLPCRNPFVAWRRAAPICASGGGTAPRLSVPLPMHSCGCARAPLPAAPPAHPARTLCSAAGSVPESIIGELYKNAFKALKPGGRLLVHDFMVNDSLDSPALGALWALQHVTVNASGLGLCPNEVGTRMTAAGFTGVETMEMIHGMTKLIVAHKK